MRLRLDDVVVDSDGLEDPRHGHGSGSPATVLDLERDRTTVGENDEVDRLRTLLDEGPGSDLCRAAASRRVPATQSGLPRIASATRLPASSSAPAIEAPMRASPATVSPNTGAPQPSTATAHGCSPARSVISATIMRCRGCSGEV